MVAKASETEEQVVPSPHSPVAIRRRRWRNIKDHLARYCIAAGGVSVIIAIVLIFFYLLYVVIPLFRPAQLEPAAQYPAPGDNGANTLHLALNEYNDMGLRLTEQGQAVFFSTEEGKVVLETPLPFPNPKEAAVTSFAAGDPAGKVIVYGLSNGHALLARHAYRVSYPDNVRTITPRLEYPLDKALLAVDPKGQPLRLISAQSDEDQTTIAAVTTDGRLVLVSFTAQQSFLDDEITVEQTTASLDLSPLQATHLVLDEQQEELYVADSEGYINYYQLRDKETPHLVQRVKAVSEEVRITALSFLAGGISLLVGDSSGQIAQWFPVRNEGNHYTLEQIRTFNTQQAPIMAIASEHARKGFLAVDSSGQVGVYHTTAHQTLRVANISKAPLVTVAIAPRADGMLASDSQGKIYFLKIENPHPEVSWQALWGKVWYESRDKPEFLWQSSSASDDFEPKFSLTPLTFGTFKAAFYAMLFAVPLAILGALYTAYFMSAKMRGLVKPTIEIMEALPTVILGFLAGLWLAPLVEDNLPGVFAFLLLLPVGVFMAAYLWRCLPSWVRQWVPEGWEAALLLPVVVGLGILAAALSQPLEVALFNGNMPQWLSTHLGIAYDQRNSLVVGFAMGFAVIPTIFSISEDAIFSVPKQLTFGSLALGATPWQTLVRVVLLTASPGIFSAVMIGLGRAVGETMIVLMATGNTPIMDFNPFQGFRALSANIAVEMPESEVDSTHYRILFLAALVLFMVTFVFNTLAEIVRQRLRKKYSSL
ncbi:ABC transporter permease subunit [Nitrosococcus watsonii]|uniref:Binding-protein-dependent transport systems inner membrane component n=1 Tax=Nitrosococcus watsoni (strain C-113) TaxID=105559 RepID=D8KBS1_NITWC|nr:ABC transporter permease subunit [Nitrosococcus watsonii]ADJ27682.1 binding-protein-dependent transport systems inner membrane component [Nitrosococcus watsonii C-113]